MNYCNVETESWLSGSWIKFYNNFGSRSDWPLATLHKWLLIPGEEYRKNHPGKIKLAIGQEWLLIGLPLRQFWLYIRNLFFFFKSSYCLYLSYMSTSSLFWKNSCLDSHFGSHYLFNFIWFRIGLWLQLGKNECFSKVPNKFSTCCLVQVLSTCWLTRF